MTPPQGGQALLVVCSANQARSPIAAALFRTHFSRLAEHGRGHLWWPVLSAGTDATPGLPLWPAMAAAMKKARFEPIEHSSEVLTPEILAQAGLTVTMTQDQRHRVNQMMPAAVASTFTLRELDRLLSSQRWLSSRHEAHDPVRHLHALRPLVPPADHREDVADPATGPAGASDAVLGELVGLVERVAGQLAGRPAGQRAPR